MKINRNIMISMTLLVLFMIPALTNYASAAGGLGVSENQNGIFIRTNYLTMRIVEDKPHFIWWYGNQSDSDEMYNVQINKIEEFFGNDITLDNQSELGGVSYNLLTTNWNTDIVEDDHYITVTLTSIGLANGAEIQFIINAYSEDQVIEGTDQTVEAFSEIKFDIIVDNWQFSEAAKGLAIRTLTLESQQRHRMRIREGTGAENGNATRTMQFESEDHGNRKVAYFEWATFANIYDESVLEDTITVGNAFLTEIPDGQGPGIQSMVEMYLTYPNYGDSLKLVHDPSIGVYPDAFAVPLYVLPIIGGLVVTVAIITIIKKRK
ncbi:MAG: hypothetical protein FK733_12235 [Asgard group archaeon]|nr:hypothetical protein [Asgard group archaeon]